MASRKPKATTPVTACETMPVTTYDRLIAFGKIYNVADGEDYKAAALTYAQEAALIAQMREQLSKDGQTVTKEYVKGRENLCVHPLIQELPGQSAV